MLLKRTIYLQKIRPFYHNELIKFLVGIRRAGKSVLLTQIIEELKEQSIQTDQILQVYLECPSENPDDCPPYTTASQELLTWLKDQGFGANGTKLYPGTQYGQFKTAVDFLPPALRDICSTLPVTVVDHPTDLDTIVCGSDSAARIKIVNAMKINSDPTDPANPTPPAGTILCLDPDSGFCQSIQGETCPAGTTLATEEQCGTGETPPGENIETVPITYNIPNFVVSNLNIPTENADLLHMLAPIFNRIINILLGLAGIIATIFIIINGYGMVTAGGNQETIKKAQTGLTYAIIGLALVLLSALILASIQSILGLAA